MAARRKSTGKRKLTRARKHPLTKAQRHYRSWYMKHRAKILRKARQYYRKNRTKILRKAKQYRRLTRGKGPFYKSGRVGGRYPRFKRLKRLNKYTRIGGRRKSGRRTRRRA